MHARLRNVILVMGVVFALQGVGWLVVPETAAAGLGMPLLEGLGRSTQVGDFAAFFLTLGFGMLAGIRAGNARMLLFPAGMLAAAALCRSVAWAIHGAAFATTFIPVEVASSLLLLVAARQAERSTRTA